MRTIKITRTEAVKEIMEYWIYRHEDGEEWQQIGERCEWFLKHASKEVKGEYYAKELELCLSNYKSLLERSSLDGLAEVYFEDICDQDNEEVEVKEE
jgi:hypothetical protein